VVDVGERPSKNHKLFPADESKPIGVGNFVWRESIVQRADGECRRAAAARYQKLYRQLRPEAYRGYALQKSYGISRNKYEKMLEYQSGKCAICEKEEGAVIRGSKISLAVDHCHDTGSIRGLLCSQCNRALGGFKDSPDLLDRAKQYLLNSRNQI